MIKLSSATFVTTTDFKKNLKKVRSSVEKAPKETLILFPEVCLSGFCYDRMGEAWEFFSASISELKELSNKNPFVLTAIIKESGVFFNRLLFFAKGEIIHTQDKYKLFRLGEEHRYFGMGKEESIKIIEYEGIKIAFLICFELRFIKLWERLKGADLICVPAMWGRDRVWQFKNLLQALALTNQCFVLSSNSINREFGRASYLFAPWGVESLSKGYSIDKKRLQIHRRYINLED